MILEKFWNFEMQLNNGNLQHFLADHAKDIFIGLWVSLIKYFEGMSTISFHWLFVYFISSVSMK